jgi:glucose-6-phosphate 1-dehydrogenase
MATSDEKHLIVLFGATGDLARRKLLPGIMHLVSSGLVGESRIVGVSLDEFDDSSFTEFARAACAEFGTRSPSDEQWATFARTLHYVNVKAQSAALLERASVGCPRRRTHAW